MQGNQESSSQISIQDLVGIVLKRRWIVIWTVGVATVLGVVVALVIPKSYEATASVFPISSSGSSQLSDYAGLASLAGINLPNVNTGNNPGKTVNALLSSRLLIETLVTDMDLTNKIVAAGKTEDERFRSLVDLVRKQLRVKEEPKTGVISITMELGDPELAQEVTNRLLSSLEKLLAKKALTSNTKKKEQLTKQILEQGKKVDEYQQQMAKFQQETTMLDPKAQAGQAMQAYATMIQQKMQLELQLSTAQASYSVDNPRVSLLRTQLSNLEAQISEVKNRVDGDLPSLKMAPENLIRYQNLTRDLEIATRIYATLLASLEQTRLSEDQSQVYIEILDRALLPEAGKPSRTMVVGASVVVGLFLGLVVVFLLHQLERRGTLGLKKKREPGEP